MQSTLIGAMTTAVIAVAASGSSGAPASADSFVGLPAAHTRPEPAVVPRQRSAPVEHYVDLNSAGRKELMTLPGIGAEEASRIIANRPYLTKTELVTKHVMPIGPFLSVRNLVVAMPRTAPKGTH
ncbi:MAG TPA: hypothetical protein VGJ56_13015 [Reyranella sp.]